METNAYQSPAEVAAIIRQELKTKGWNASKISVKASSGAVRVTIKTPGISLATVREIAEQHESIRRDGWGEILLGGNLYIFVSMDYDLLNVESKKLEAWAKSLSIHDRQLKTVNVAGNTFHVGRSSEWSYTIFQPQGPTIPQNSYGVAEFFASQMIQAGVSVAVPVAA